MNKAYKIKLIMCSALLSAPVHADLIDVFKAKANIWQSFLPSLVGSDPQSMQDLRFGEDSYNYYYLNLEPIGFTELQLAYADISTIEDGTPSEAFKPASFTYPISTESETATALNTRDLTMHWQVLDTAVDADLGITSQYIDGRFKANGPVTRDSVGLSSVAPLAFMRARFDLPYTGWYLEGDTHLIKYDGNRYSDSAIKLGWQTESLADFGLNIGYRAMSLNVEDLDGLNTDLNISGPFASANFHF